MNVVQFIHPGDEITVTGPNVGWHTKGEHRRRLLCHAGEYVDGNNNCNHDDNLCFWNEYEAPTQAHPILQSQGWDFAQYYHTIIKPIPPSPNRQRKCQDDALDECCDNTDPCVFGETFKYSNCQQVPNGDLWNLPQGSLIMFGSHHENSFYLDTVFVTQAPGVSYSVPIALHQLPFRVSNDYKIVTLDNLMPKRNKKNKRNPIIRQFMFYRGRLPLVNVKHQVDGQDIFSFTPTRIFNTPDYNMRCKIDLTILNQRIQPYVPAHCLFSSGLKQSHKTIVFKATTANVAAIWREVRDIVINASFKLGYHFSW